MRFELLDPISRRDGCWSPAWCAPRPLWRRWARAWAALAMVALMAAIILFGLWLAFPPAAQIAAGWLR
jgi:hypothetical protein